MRVGHDLDSFPNPDKSCRDYRAYPWASRNGDRFVSEVPWAGYRGPIKPKTVQATGQSGETEVRTENADPDAVL